MSNDNERQSTSMRDYMPEEDKVTGEEAEKEPTPVEKQPVESEETPSKEPEAPAKKGEEPPKEKAEEKAKEEESKDQFTDKVKLDKLPPELQTVYKQMQGDYTRKTQGIADVRKNADQYGRYKALIDYLGQNPQAAQSVIARMQGQPEAPQPSDEEVEIPTDPKEFANFVKEQAVKETEERFNRVLEEQKRATQRYQYISQQAEEAQKLDPRLSSDNDFGEMIASMVQSDSQVATGQKTIVQATKDAISKYDSYYSSRLSAEMEKLSDEAKAKRNPSPPDITSDTTPQKKQPQSIRESHEQLYGGK